MSTEHDLLLAFLSEKGSGSWAELKAAWEWIDDGDDDQASRAWIVAQDLAALGHLEIAWGDSQWCVAPPLLSMIPRSGGRVLVTGARTRWLHSPDAGGALQDAVDELELWLDCCDAPRGPTTLYVSCESERDARRLAEKLAISYTYGVARQISALLPPLESYTQLWPVGGLPRGFEAERFDPARLIWVPVGEAEGSEGSGLYKCRAYAGDVYALNGGPLGWRRVSKELGIYELLRWENTPALEYDSGRQVMSVSPRAPLPSLHARAATLCSGRLPFFRSDTRRLEYVNVTHTVAELIAASLSQTLLEPALT